MLNLVRVACDIECPWCGHDDGLQITVNDRGLWIVGGSDCDNRSDGTRHWDGDGLVECAHCLWRGGIADAERSGGDR
jgi:hypothetical protein